MKIVFMGTPDFAVGALEALIESEHEIVAVVTQPDKAKGRSSKLQLTPVKECALKQGIPVVQPAKIKTPETVEMLRGYGADLFVVAAFGQILSRQILELAKFGCVNIHASLLPKYRGAAPIQWAILNGEEETGITLMQMNEGLDTGDMLTECRVKIEPEDTAETLFIKLSKAGAGLLIDTLPEIEAGTIQPKPQDEAKSSYAPMIKRQMGRIDWNQSAVYLARKVRAFNSWPSAFTSLKGKTLKIWEAAAEEGKSDVLPGTVCGVGTEGIKVQTGEGILCIQTLQLEGKKRMDTKAFLSGYRLDPGTVLGE